MQELPVCGSSVHFLKSPVEVELEYQEPHSVESAIPFPQRISAGYFWYVFRRSNGNPGLFCSFGSVRNDRSTQLSSWPCRTSAETARCLSEPNAATSKASKPAAASGPPRSLICGSARTSDVAGQKVRIVATSRCHTIHHHGRKGAPNLNATLTGTCGKFVRPLFCFR